MSISSLFQVIAGFVWLSFFAAVAYMVFRSSRNNPVKQSRRLLVILGVVAILITSMSAGVVFVQPGEAGVVISYLSPNGYRTTALQSGLHFIIPFLETVQTYPISMQTYTMSIAPNEGAIQGDDSISARTLDGQEIFVDASVIYKIDPDKVVQVHIQWKNGYNDGLIRPQARGVIRDVISQYKVDEVVSTKRIEMTVKIREALAAKLSENGLMLVDYVLRNIAFSTEYGASIEQKQIAEQQAQQAKLVVEQKKQEAEQARQTAKGAADAAVIAAKGAAEARLMQAEAEAKAIRD